jgi:hypothetical protein
MKFFINIKKSRLLESSMFFFLKIEFLMVNINVWAWANGLGYTAAAVVVVAQPSAFAVTMSL